MRDRAGRLLVAAVMQLLAGFFFLAFLAGGVRPSLAAASGSWMAILVLECGVLLLGLLGNRPARNTPYLPLVTSLAASLAFFGMTLTAIRSLDLPYLQSTGVGVAAGWLAQASLLFAMPRLRLPSLLRTGLRWSLTPSSWSAAQRGSIPALLLCLAGGMVLTFLIFLPVLSWSGNGIDDAWMRIIPWAQERGVIFGRELIYNYGPLGWLHPPPAGSAWLTAHLVYAAAYSLLFALGLWLLAGRAWRWSLPLAWLIILLVHPHSYNSATIYALALLAFLVGREPGRSQHLWTLACCCFLAVVALGKFSHVLPVLLTVAALDLDRFLARRAWPVFVPTWCAALAVTQLAIGQPLSALDDLLRAMLLIIVGYAEATQTEVATLQQPALLLLNVALVAIATLAATGRALSEPAGSVRRWLLPPLLLAALAFLAWKGAMVRGHLDAWGAVTLLASIVLLGPASDVVRRLMGQMAAAVIGLCGVLLFYDAYDRPFTFAEVSRYFESRWTRSQTFLVGQSAASLDARAAEVDAQVRAAEPWPAVQGTVDVLGDRQMPALAWGLDYRPRPVMQSVFAQNRALAEMNLAFYRSDHAPQHLFADWTGIDNRWPGMDDGRLRLELIGRYRPVGLAGSYLQLERWDESPWQMDLGPPQRLALAFNVPVELDLQGKPTFARFEVHHSLLGLMAEALWRPPIVKVRLDLADGSKRVHRVVLGMLDVGLILSPYLADLHAGLAFYDVNLQAPLLQGAEVKRLTLLLPDPVIWFYEDAVTLELSPIELRRR